MYHLQQFIPIGLGSIGLRVKYCIVYLGTLENVRSIPRRVPDGLVVAIDVRINPGSPCLLQRSGNIDFVVSAVHLVALWRRRARRTPLNCDGYASHGLRRGRRWSWPKASTREVKTWFESMCVV